MSRPKKENGKTRHLDVRLSEEEYETLDRMSKISGKTKTEIIMSGIKINNWINEKKGVKNMSRPKKDACKDKIITVRFTKEEYETLDKISKISGKTKSELMKDGLRITKNLFSIQYEID